MASKSLVTIFHGIDSCTNADPFSISSERFLKMLDIFKHLGSCSITPCVTFDDGLETSYIFAAEALQKSGLSARFFIVSSWVGKPGYMSWNQIRELHRNGMSIGSHTASHLNLELASDEAISKELLESKETIENRLGSSVNDLALPGGFAKRYAIGRAFEIGYKNVFSSHPGIWNGSAQVVPRLCIRRSCNEKVIERICKGELTSYFAWEYVKSQARNVLGTHLYNKIRMITGRDKWHER